jgi:hypothetical protein
MIVIPRDRCTEAVILVTGDGYESLTTDARDT